MKEWIVPCGTPSCAAVSGAGLCVGPMTKFPSAPAGGSVPSGSSVACGNAGLAGSRVGGAVPRFMPDVSMRNGAAWSVVLAPGGTEAAPVTHACCARAGAASTAQSTASIVTMAIFFIVGVLPPAVLPRRGTLWRAEAGCQFPGDTRSKRESASFLKK